MRIKFAQTGDTQYAIQMSRENTLYWEDLLQFRENGGLSGHAEMEGKTLFLKFNTGPSGHGAPVADGEALALKRAGAGEVRVFAFDGEGGMTPGGVHEALNSAYGLGLDNLYYVLDWNDFGIDSHTVSSVVYGTPNDWFGAHGWRVFGTEHGSEWAPVSEAILQAVNTENPEHRPNAIWVKTRKGRGYYKYDYASHGAPHKTDSDLFWQTKKDFADKYGVEFTNFGCPPPADQVAYKHEYEANLKAVIDVLHADQSLVDFLADTLVALGNRVPESIPVSNSAARGIRSRMPACMITKIIRRNYLPNPVKK